MKKQAKQIMLIAIIIIILVVVFSLGKPDWDDVATWIIVYVVVGPVLIYIASKLIGKKGKSLASDLVG